MSTRFENWFVHFVAEHNAPPPHVEGGELKIHKCDSLQAGFLDETGLAMVSNKNAVFYRPNVLSFRSRGTRARNSRSVA